MMQHCNYIAKKMKALSNHVEVQRKLSIIPCRMLETQNARIPKKNVKECKQYFSRDVWYTCGRVEQARLRCVAEKLGCRELTILVHVFYAHRCRHALKALQAKRGDAVDEWERKAAETRDGRCGWKKKNGRSTKYIRLYYFKCQWEWGKKRAIRSRREAIFFRYCS